MTGTSTDTYLVRAFMHTPGEPLGYLEQIFSEHGVPFEYVRLWEGERVCAGDATHLVFLGGPMSVNDERDFPWLAEEKTLIRYAVRRRIPVLGLCLGAQLIASAHGATVYRFVNETGWCTVHRVPEASGILSAFPYTFQAFQMHNDTFHLPVHSRLVCRGDAVPHQGFRLGSALGLQFHLEMTGELIDAWTRNERTFLRQTITRDTGLYLADSNTLCRKVAEEFLGLH